MSNAYNHLNMPPDEDIPSRLVTVSVALDVLAEQETEDTDLSQMRRLAENFRKIRENIHITDTGPHFTDEDDTIKLSLDNSRLVLANLGVVGHVARTFGHLPSNVTVEEIIAAGNEGLIQASMTFDPHLGYEFSTYAQHRVRGAIIDYLRTLDIVPRSIRRSARIIDNDSFTMAAETGIMPSVEEVAERSGISVESINYTNMIVALGNMASLDVMINPTLDNAADVADGTKTSQEEAVLNRELSEYLRDAITSLPDKQRYVVEAYFYREEVLDEIGFQLGITESRVSQILTNAINALKRRLKSY